MDIVIKGCGAKASQMHEHAVHALRHMGLEGTEGVVRIEFVDPDDWSEWATVVFGVCEMITEHEYEFQIAVRNDAHNPLHVMLHELAHVYQFVNECDPDEAECDALADKMRGKEVVRW